MSARIARIARIVLASILGLTGTVAAQGTLPNAAQAKAKLQKSSDKILKEFDKRSKKEFVKELKAELKVFAKAHAAGLIDEVELLVHFLEVTAQAQTQHDELALLYAEFLSAQGNSLQSAHGALVNAFLPGTCGPVDDFNNGMQDRLIESRARLIQAIKKALKVVNKQTDTNMIFTVPRVTGAPADAIVTDPVPFKPVDLCRGVRVLAFGGTSEDPTVDDGRVGLIAVAGGATATVELLDAAGNVIASDLFFTDEDCRVRFFFPEVGLPPNLPSGVYRIIVSSDGQTVTSETAVP